SKKLRNISRFIFCATMKIDPKKPKNCGKGSRAVRTLFNKLTHFILLGIIIVVLIAGFILFSYLLIWGAIVGLVLFLFAWIKETFFPSNNLTIQQREKKPGRTIDHDDH